MRLMLFMQKSAILARKALLLYGNPQVRLVKQSLYDTYFTAIPDVDDLGS